MPLPVTFQSSEFWPKEVIAKRTSTAIKFNFFIVFFYLLGLISFGYKNSSYF